VSSGNRNGQLPPKSADALPDSDEPNGPCPRCGRASNFTVRMQAPISFNRSITRAARDEVRHSEQQVSALDCQGCGQGIVVVEEKFIGGVTASEALEGAGPERGRLQWRGIHWWPTPGMTPLSPDLPAAVADEVAEGTRCLAVQAPRAAVVMFRGALAEVVQDRGSAAAKGKDTLFAQLKQMTDDGDLVATLSDWASHIRVLGNAGAHPSTLSPVSMAEAEELLRLVNALLEYLYVMPAKVQRARAARP
jgi:hypothetical protein